MHVITFIIQNIYYCIYIIQYIYNICDKRPEIENYHKYQINLSIIYSYFHKHTLVMYRNMALGLVIIIQ